MDIRIQKTRKRIFDAFVSLRESYPIEKITVKELAEKAGISKQTFYLHYKDIYDLSAKIEEELIDNLTSDVLDRDDVFNHVDEITISLFRYSMSQGTLYKTIFSDSRSYILIESLEKKIKSAIFNQNPELRADLKANIYITTLIQGCYHAYQQYSAINQDLVSKELGDIARSITESYIRR